MRVFDHHSRFRRSSDLLPGSSAKEAQIVEVGPGALLVNMDFALVRSPGAGVSGRVKGLPQDTLADLRVVLMLANPPNGPLKWGLTLTLREDLLFEPPPKREPESCTR